MLRVTLLVSDSHPESDSGAALFTGPDFLLTLLLKAEPAQDHRGPASFPRGPEEAVFPQALLQGKLPRAPLGRPWKAGMWHQGRKSVLYACGPASFPGSIRNKTQRSQEILPSFKLALSRKPSYFQSAALQEAVLKELSKKVRVFSTHLGQKVGMTGRCLCVLSPGLCQKGGSDSDSPALTLLTLLWL